MASQVPSRHIAKTVEPYKRAGSGNVPKLIFPTTTVVGEFMSGDSLVELIRQQVKHEDYERSNSEMRKNSRQVRLSNDDLVSIQ